MREQIAVARQSDAYAIPSWFIKLGFLVLILCCLPTLIPVVDDVMRAEGSVTVAVVWFDSSRQAKRRFALTLFPQDNSVEMHDVDAHKVFLARHKLGEDEELAPADLFVGNTITLLSRRLEIIEYGDERSSQSARSVTQPTFAMVKPDAVRAGNIGAIVRMAEQASLRVTRAKMVNLSRDEAREFYVEHQHRNFFDELLDYVTSGPVVGLELRGHSSVSTWRQLLGPTDSKRARTEEPESVRARFGTDKTLNAAHGSDSDSAAARELNFFFGTSESGLKSNSKLSSLNGLTCCLLRPQLIRDLDGVGQVVEAIEKSDFFEIKAVNMMHLNEQQASKFLEVYKGVVDDHATRVKDLASGRSLALAIGFKSTVRNREDKDLVSSFREFVGPFDSDLANSLRSNTLRGQFGNSLNLNGIHCTDLTDDAGRELNFFF